VLYVVYTSASEATALWRYRSFIIIIIIIIVLVLEQHTEIKDPHSL